MPNIFKFFSRGTARVTAVGAFLYLNGVAGAALINQTVTAPGDSIYGIAITGGNTSGTAEPSASTVSASTNNGFGSNSSPPGEFAPNAIDGTNAKYLNFEGTSTNNSAGNYGGLIVTPSGGGFGPTRLTGVQFRAGNDSNDRDPLTITIEGTNTPIPTNPAPTTDGPAGTVITAAWTLVYSGVSGLATDPGRDALGASVPITTAPATGFSSYRVLVTSVRGDPSETCCFQFDEINLIGTSTPAPEPTALSAVGVAGLGLLARRRRRA